MNSYSNRSAIKAYMPLNLDKLASESVGVEAG